MTYDVPFNEDDCCLAFQGTATVGVKPRRRKTYDFPEVDPSVEILWVRIDRLYLCANSQRIAIRALQSSGVEADSRVGD